MKLSKTQYAVIALIIANIIWGAASPIFKWSLQDIGPFTLAFLRFSIATLLILPFAIKKLRFDIKDLGLIFAAIFFGVTINISFFFQGLKYAPSINAPIIASAGPIFLILFSMLFLREKPKRKLIMGGLIGLLGVLLIVIKPLLSQGTDLSILGNVFYLVALGGALGHTILGRKIMQKYEAITIAFWSFFIGSLTFTPFFLNEISSTGFLPGLNIQGIIGILFGAILCSALAYFLFYWALKYLPACETGVFTYIDPIIAVLIAIPLLGEIPDPIYILGSILVFGGIYVAEGRIHYHPFQKLTKP